MRYPDSTPLHAGPALLTADRTVSHAELDDLVAQAAARLGSTPRLVLLEMNRTIESVVWWLGCLRARHPVVLAPPGGAASREQLDHTYDPDVVIDGDGMEVRRLHTVHSLHPELAALLSTSGSTGSPKLVRLSATNLCSNAGAIAAALRLGTHDRGITTLPFNYCFGLSILNSHLVSGGAVVLTENSVVDPCFWEAARQHGVTNLAGVPHTFDLLDQVGFSPADLPTLRLVTQAGGRLGPERVADLAERCDAHDVDFRVMYGQTEATARMSITEPGMAAASPGVVGRAIGDGRFSIRPVDDHDLGDRTVGELVYRGSNVMMGYAETPADLSGGHEHDELLTGDLARIGGDGVVEIVGRTSRFVKIFGLRIDLDRIEARLAA